MWRIKGGQSSPAKHTACYHVAIVSCKCEGVNCCSKHSALHFHCVNCNGGAGKERRANSCELLPAHWGGANSKKVKKKSKSISGILGWVLTFFDPKF